jgi:hypothetical protein
VSAKFAIKFRVRADQGIYQTLPTVAVFVLLTIEYGLFFWMEAAVMFVDHSASNLIEKILEVKISWLTSFAAWGMGHGA